MTSPCRSSGAEGLCSVINVELIDILVAAQGFQLRVDLREFLGDNRGLCVGKCEHIIPGVSLRFVHMHDVRSVIDIHLQ